MNRERIKGSGDYSTQRHRGTEEMTRGIPLEVKAREEGPPSTQGPGFCRSREMAWLSDCRGSPQHKPALLRALGQESQGQCQDQAPGWRQCWARATQPPTYYRHPRTARLVARREGAGTHTTGTRGGLAPGLARESHARTGARLQKGAPPWLTSLPTAGQGSPAYPGDSWALRTNSVPSNYSMENE